MKMDIHGCALPANLTVMNEIERNIVKELNSVRNDLEAWGTHVDHVLVNQVLEELITNNTIKLWPKHRLKGDRSYLFKVLYRERKYTQPLVEIEDKVATRIVLLKSDYIQKVADLIMSYDGWNSKMTKNLQDAIEDQPKQFDYQSCHIVVWPKEDYKAGCANEILTCEIQIRTLLQHAFAEVSHDSVYKGVYRNDGEILRHLAKSMALMESTDDYFCEIFDLMANEQRTSSIFIKELIRLYMKFAPDFDKSKMNYDLNYRIYDLMQSQPITIDELDAFIVTHGEPLRRAIKPKNGLLFAEPVILIVAYYLFKQRDWLKINWPLSHESLETVFQAFNISFDRY